MIFSDYIFSIGKEHKVCEDYVIIDNEKVPLIIVADGCSSSDFSDIGARLLSFNSKNFIKEHFLSLIDNKNYVKDIFLQTFLYNKSISLNENSLDCTLLFAFIYKEKLHYFVVGDGIVNYKIKNEIVTQNFSFPEEKVFYGNYFNNVTRLNFYHKSNLPLKIETIYSDSFYNKIEETKDYIYYNSLNINDLDYFFLSTDGLLSCSSDKVFSKKIFFEFLEFKNLKGEFIQRRYKNWLKKINKEGINHADDIGIAGFSFFEDSL
jgi:serine/threonine protein phosphatase PrpC